MSNPVLDSPCLALYTESLPIRSGTFIRESHSQLYSPEVFAISQLLSEIPNSVVCAIVYWVLMVYPIGFGGGFTGLNGTGFQLLAIIFTELFGVTLAQLVGALAPSIQVRSLSSFMGLFIDSKTHLCAVSAGWNAVQFRDRYSAIRDLRCYHSVPRHSELAASMAVRVEPLGQDHVLDGLHRATVRPSSRSLVSKKGPLP